MKTVFGLNSHFSFSITFHLEDPTCWSVFCSLMVTEIMVIGEMVGREEQSVVYGRGN